MKVSFRLTDSGGGANVLVTGIAAALRRSGHGQADAHVEAVLGGQHDGAALGGREDVEGHGRAGVEDDLPHGQPREVRDEEAGAGVHDVEPLEAGEAVVASQSLDDLRRPPGPRLVHSGNGVAHPRARSAREAPASGPRSTCALASATAQPK